MLAGVNPVVIRRLQVNETICSLETFFCEGKKSSFLTSQEFPPKSTLDHREYGSQDSTITREHLEKNMNGLAVDEVTFLLYVLVSSIQQQTIVQTIDFLVLCIKQAMERNKLFILDHHDALMPYLRRINSTTTKTYASRTILLLQDDGTLKPLAIELSLPHEDGDVLGAMSEVFTPSDHRVGNSIWQLAKAYASVNDSGYHQLISHWYMLMNNYQPTRRDDANYVQISMCRLNTHAVMEPFVIATNRQLSVLHPIHKLLKPHFRDTVHINALARQILINAGGVLEITVFPARYAMEMSSFVYRNWKFTDHALPVDLIKRFIAES